MEEKITQKECIDDFPLPPRPFGPVWIQCNPKFDGQANIPYLCNFQTHGHIILMVVMWVYIYIHMYTYVYIYICIYIYTCIYIYIHVYICIIILDSILNIIILCIPIKLYPINSQWIGYIRIPVYSEFMGYHRDIFPNSPLTPIPSGNQTWLAGKSTIYFDYFPGCKLAFI